MGSDIGISRQQTPGPSAEQPAEVDLVALEAAAASMPLRLRPLYDRYNIVLLPVPAGEFTMGDQSGAGDGDERPAHTVYTGNFWIGLTEITNGQYQIFVDAGAYRDPSLWSEAGWAWRQSEAIAQPACWAVADLHTPELPLSSVSWYEADAYSRWLARETGLPLRLPTEAEWEKAARGPDARLYPWGDEPPGANHATLFGAEDGAPFSASPGSFPDGASPYAVLDMSGNVWEWTSTLYADYPYDAQDGREDPDSDRDRVVRGGSWASMAEQARTTARYKDDPADWDGLQGFRLALTE